MDEVLEILNESGVFSKLDLRWDFHQIELDPKSRDVTAFATHDDILRYKRLSLGAKRRTREVLAYHHPVNGGSTRGGKHRR